MAAMLAAIPALLAAALSAALTHALATRLAGFAVDRPNDRSLHEVPVPRTGGIAVLAGAAVSLAFGASSMWAVLTLAVILAGLSFLDDLSHLPTAARLAAH